MGSRVEYSAAERAALELERRRSRALSAVPTPDLAECAERFNVLQDEHRRVMAKAWLGALVSEFSNAELRVLMDYLTIQDVLDLRRLGLFGPNEGWDGSKKSRSQRPGTATTERGQVSGE